MNTENVGTTQAKPNKPNAASWWGPEMAEMMKAWPCASFCRGSRTAMGIMMTVMGLVFLIAVTGIVLGIIAFFRTF